MPRSRRGFQLQQFLPGNIVPSTASKPTGVVPEAAQSLGSMQSPAFNAGASKPTQGVSQITGQNIPMGLQSPAAVAAVNPAPTSGSKFGDIQKALGGISLSAGKVLGGAPNMASQFLGADAASTDWAKLLGYTGQGSDLISAALKQYGITKPAGGLGAMNSFSPDWMKAMGLV